MLNIVPVASGSASSNGRAGDWLASLAGDVARTGLIVAFIVACHK